MASGARFPFTQMDALLGEASLLPLLPLHLTHKNRTLQVSGLLDTGSVVNVMPHSVGLALGADWEAQRIHVRLTGNLAKAEARALVVSAAVADFAPVRLAFAWTQAEDVPLILGQVNFFSEFDVSFSRSARIFEVHLPGE